MLDLRYVAIAVTPILVFVACATPPDVVYGEAGDGSVADPPEGGIVPPPDATIDGSGSDDGGVSGTDTGTDSSSHDDGGATDAALDVTVEPDAGDDGGDDAGPLACDGGTVSACSACPGAPLRCKQTCVSSCDQCGPKFLACIHCNGQNQITRQVCMAVPANGQLACTGNLCGCDASSECPTSPGASILCAVEPTSQSDRCLTCGAPGTADAPCPLLDGGTGICHVEAGTIPTCD
ncbi:MAG TPA: hypothetical protein VGI39_10750 [Polyangiaceae bacterium]|jgi:hypothetical protein